MKLIKVLLSSMFVFTAVIRSADVGVCGGRHHRYTGILVHYEVRDLHNNVVEADETACAYTWPELQKDIQFNLKTRQEVIDSNTAEQQEEQRLRKAAKELVGVEVRGE